MPVTWYRANDGKMYPIYSGKDFYAVTNQYRLSHPAVRDGAPAGTKEIVYQNPMHMDSTGRLSPDLSKPGIMGTAPMSGGPMSPMVMQPGGAIDHKPVKFMHKPVLVVPPGIPAIRPTVHHNSSAVHWAGLWWSLITVFVVAFVAWRYYVKHLE